MSLTEREKEIVMEAINNHGGYNYDEQVVFCIDDYINAIGEILFRIREEQEAFIVGSDGSSLVKYVNSLCWKQKLPAGTKLYTTPPATLPNGNRTECVVSPYSSRCCEKGTKGCDVDHCDCSELVEALKKINKFLWREGYTTSNEEIAFVEQALANHAKRMKE